MLTLSFAATPESRAKQIKHLNSSSKLWNTGFPRILLSQGDGNVLFLFFSKKERGDTFHFYLKFNWSSLRDNRADWHLVRGMEIGALLNGCYRATGNQARWTAGTGSVAPAVNR